VDDDHNSGFDLPKGNKKKAQGNKGQGTRNKNFISIPTATATTREGGSWNKKMK
jgi:hypothetical protein